MSITVDDPADGERKFKALLEGGSINMPFGKTFFSKGFGMGVDQFGIPWMVNCPVGMEAIPGTTYTSDRWRRVHVRAAPACATSDRRGG